MRKVVVPALIAIVFLLSGAAVSMHMLKKPAPATDCGSVKAMSMKLMAGHLGFLATSIDDKNRVYMTFLNGKTGDWAMIHVYPHARRACLFMRGYNWQFVLMQRIKKQAEKVAPIRR